MWHQLPRSLHSDGPLQHWRRGRHTHLFVGSLSSFRGLTFHVMPTLTFWVLCMFAGILTGPDGQISPLCWRHRGTNITSPVKSSMIAKWNRERTLTSLLSQLASNVSSFAVCTDFLLITTHSHTCRCLHLSSLTLKGRTQILYKSHSELLKLVVRLVLPLVSKWPLTLQGCRWRWPQMEVRMTRRCGGWREDPGSSPWFLRILKWFYRSV